MPLQCLPVHWRNCLMGGREVPCAICASPLGSSRPCPNVPSAKIRIAGFTKSFATQTQHLRRTP
jgi:hypothetical protein